MAKSKPQPYLESTLGKVIAAVVLGTAALLVYWSGTRLAFDEVLGTVETATAPNERLYLVNKLFRDIIRLDQEQRMLAVEQPGNVSGYTIRSSEEIHQTMDELRWVLASDSVQLNRLDDMRGVLEERDRLFLNYISLRSDLMSNKGLSAQVRSLAGMLGESRRKPTEQLVTGQSTRTRTTTILPADTIRIEPEPERPSMLRRVFGGRRASEIAVVTPVTMVEEEVDTITDSVVMTVNDSLVALVESRLRNIERVQQMRSTRLLESEIEFLSVSAALITELIDILHEIEDDEIAASEADQAAARQLVSDAVDRSVWFLILLIGGAFVMLFLVATDISRSRKYRRELARAKEAAENLSQVKHRFLANMSHEIRTPLQTIVGFAEQMRTQSRADQTALDAIFRSSVHLLQIVNEVLDYSRIVSGKFVFTDQPFRVAEVLHEVAGILRSQAVKKGLQFEFETNAENTDILMGDAFRLKQVLINLGGNAVKYTRQGKVSLIAVVRYEDEKPMLELLVEDTGIGMEEEDLKRIFDEFEQAGKPGEMQASGTGLGLSIAKALITAQNGTIQVKSAKGEGTSFWVMIPFTRADSLPETDEARPEWLLTGVHAHIGKVLIIDDDPYILKLYREILQKHGVACETLLQTSGEETLPEGKFCMVFTDIRMPGKDGLMWLAELRASHGEEYPVIAATAQVLQEETASLVDAGFTDILRKPFREADLIGLVARYAGNAGKETEAMAGKTEESLTPDHEDLFIAETRIDLQQAGTALLSSSSENLTHALHRMAGRLGQAGHRDLYVRLRRAEVDLRDADLREEDKEAIAALLADVEKLIKTLALYSTEESAQIGG